MCKKHRTATQSKATSHSGRPRRDLSASHSIFCRSEIPQQSYYRLPFLPQPWSRILTDLGLTRPWTVGNSFMERHGRWQVSFFCEEASMAPTRGRQETKLCRAISPLVVNARPWRLARGYDKASGDSPGGAWKRQFLTNMKRKEKKRIFLHTKL